MEKQSVDNKKKAKQEGAPGHAIGSRCLGPNQLRQHDSGPEIKGGRKIHLAFTMGNLGKAGWNQKKLAEMLYPLKGALKFET